MNGVNWQEARSKTADTAITAAVAAAVAEQKCEISPSESRESKLKEPKHLGLLLDLLVSLWTCLAGDADRCVCGTKSRR